MKNVCRVMLIGLAVVGVGCAGNDSAFKIKEEVNKRIVELAIRASNEGNWEVMQTLYSQRFVQHSPGSLEPLTWEDYELGCRIVRRTFPTFHCKIEDKIAEGDKVAVRLKTIFTYKPRYGEKEGKEKEIVLTEINLIRLEGGKIVEQWCEYDKGYWRQQLKILMYY